MASHRLRWPELPLELRHDVEALLGAPVVGTQLLHSLDDGDWVVGVFEYVDGLAPRTPWDDAELQRIACAVGELAASELTEGLRALPPVSERIALTGWRTIQAHPHGGPLDDWSRTHLDQLVALEAGWAGAARGESLVHLDVRSDNILVEPTGRVVFVDWTQTGIGAPWFDLVLMLPSIALEGGGDPEDLLRGFSISAAPDAITAVVAALAGSFVERGRLPDPADRPRLPAGAGRRDDAVAAHEAGRLRTAVASSHERNATPARRHRRHQGDRRRHPPHRAPRPLDAPRAARLGGAPPARARGRRTAGVDL